MSLDKLIDLIDSASLENIETFHKYLGEFIEKQKRKPRDSRLEDALIYLAEQCDGATSNDGKGFSGVDARFGRQMAQRAQTGMLTWRAARAALKMTKKYGKQLERGGIILPEWDEIKEQYSERYQDDNKAERNGREKYIDVAHGQIRVFHPYDPTGVFQRKAKSIKGRFAAARLPDSAFWGWPESAVMKVLETFPQEDGFVVSEDVFTLAMHLEEKNKETQSIAEQQAEEKSGKLIRLLEHAGLDEPLPNGWLLMNHQKEAVQWLLERHNGLLMHGGILADDMGLGKTIEALVAAKAMQTVYGCIVFVVCPASLKDVWLAEAEKVGVMIEVYSWRKQPQPLEDREYIVIADEAHAAQSTRTAQTKNLMKLAHHENCKAIWCLTGTPMKNGRPINLYPLLTACGHSLAENKKRYEETYCNAHMKEVKRGKWIYDTTGSSHMAQLAKRTEDVILRRIKSECIDLPPKTRQMKPVEISTAENRQYANEIAKAIIDYKQKVDEGVKSENAEALVTLNAIRRFSSKYKIPTAINMAEELLEQGQKVVLFTEFIDTAEMLHERLGGELLTGNTKIDDRKPAIDRFQEGDSKVFVGTVKAGGVGITLHAASHNILVDRPWTPGDALQAEDRCHRTGQVHPVNTYWLQLGTTDYAIDQLLEEKQGRIDLVLRGKTKTLTYGLNSPQELAREILEAMGA